MRLKFLLVTVLLIFCAGCNRHKDDSEPYAPSRPEYPLIVENDEQTIQNARFGDEKMPCGKYFFKLKSEPGVVMTTALVGKPGMKTVTYILPIKEIEVIIDPKYKKQPTIEQFLTPKKVRTIIRIEEDFDVAQRCMPIDNLASFQMKR